MRRIAAAALATPVARGEESRDGARIAPVLAQGRRAPRSGGLPCRVRAAGVVGLVGVLSGCFGGHGAGVRAPTLDASGALRETGLRAPDDLTVRGARLLPEALDAGRPCGVDPGGGARRIAGGLRVLSYADGSIVAARDALPSTPTEVVVLPDRMGGGFLYAYDHELWRSETWLGEAAPIRKQRASIEQILIGLDRIYLELPSVGLTAIDPRTGANLDLGPLPASPRVASLAALDGWRAVAVADLRGVLLTLDAGSTWHPLELPMQPTDVRLVGRSLVLSASDEGLPMQAWEVRADGGVGLLLEPGAWQALGGTASRRFCPSGTPTDGDLAADPPAEAQARPWGPRPLAAAIEDGWPLTDGTALVARDGAMARVRLADGAVVERVPDAFSLAHARCHPLGLARPSDPGAFGFVCGEPAGPTVVLRWQPRAGRLVEVRRFEWPREVLSFGNGALGARGPCDARAAGTATSRGQVWCLMAPGGAWRDLLVRGDDPGRERLVALADGRVLLVDPPRGGALSTARLTVIDGSRATSLPLLFDGLDAAVERLLGLGLWMDGFEERRPGVLGGWVDGGGVTIGVEIDAGGHARVGEYLRDAGAPFVSGRWGFGWTASGIGYETTNGGMTWKERSDLPDPLSPPFQVGRRACGPVGCIAAGWLRVGWGGSPPSPPKSPPSRGWLPPKNPPPLHLECDAVSDGALPLGPDATIDASWRSPGPVTAPDPAPAGALLGPGPLDHDVGVVLEAQGLKLQPGSPSFGRIYAWGPHAGHWDGLGRWQVKWLSPWAGCCETRSTAVAPSPWPTLQAAKQKLYGLSSSTSWMLVPGDDADHALLVGSPNRGGGPLLDEVMVLAVGQVPVVVHRPGGDAFAAFEDARRVEGRWYMATAQGLGEPAATVVWRLDGPVAQELVRVPRVADPHALRLAARADGRALGLVVVGQPDGEHETPRRWVESMDVDSGALGEPEPLTAIEWLGGAVPLCTGDDGGWELEMPYRWTIHLRAGPGMDEDLQSVVARMRFTRERACLEGVTGSMDMGGAALRASRWVSRVPRGARTVDVSVLANGKRYGMRCAPAAEMTSESPGGR